MTGEELRLVEEFECDVDQAKYQQMSGLWIYTNARSDLCALFRFELAVGLAYDMQMIERKKVNFSSHGIS